MTPADDVTWSEIAAADLDARTLYDVLVLRSAVFVVEQACAYQDPDGLDLLEDTLHLVGRFGVGGIAAYARILAPGDQHATPCIGRVIVDDSARGQQVGRLLMERALASCTEHWPGEAVELGGQAHLTGFYTSLGFAVVGVPYVEDGIPHVWMRREPG